MVLTSGSFLDLAVFLNSGCFFLLFLMCPNFLLNAGCCVWKNSRDWGKWYLCFGHLCFFCHTVSVASWVSLISSSAGLGFPYSIVILHAAPASHLSRGELFSLCLVWDLACWRVFPSVSALSSAFSIPYVPVPQKGSPSRLLLLCHSSKLLLLIT